MERIAIIGAGLAGATLSQELVNAGKEVTVFEKSRGTGGRLSSARLGTLSGDLGADYYYAEDADFSQFLSSLTEMGVVVPWETEILDFAGNNLGVQPLWVGQGRNSGVTRTLLEGAHLISDTRIGVVWPDREGVLLRDDQGEQLGYFDAVVCTAPAPQSAPLLESKPRFKQVAEHARTEAAWVYLIETGVLPERLKSVGIVKGAHQAFAQICVDSSKPGRSGNLIKVTMNPGWTAENLNLSPETIGEEIHHLLEHWCDQPLSIVRKRTHRWLYNRSFQPSPESEPLWDAELGIGACGDWVADPGFEGSWRSARNLAARMLSCAQSAA